MKQKLLIAVLLLAGVLAALSLRSTWKNDSAQDTDDRFTTPPPADFGAGNSIVIQAAANLKASRPLVATGRFRINYFDVNISGPAKIVIQGNANQLGGNRTRSEFSFAIDNTRHQLIHIRDGQFSYFLKQVGDDEVLEFVDRRTVVDDGLIEDFPTLESGNLVSLLGQLSIAFDFSSPREIENGETKAIELIGHWRPEQLHRYFADENDPKKLERWKRDGLPEQVPDRVILVLAKNDEFPLFPYRIEFQKSMRTNGLTSHEMRMVTSFEVLELQRAATIPDDFFKVQPGVYQPYDRTAFYVDRIRELEDSTTTNHK